MEEEPELLAGARAVHGGGMNGGIGKASILSQLCLETQLLLQGWERAEGGGDKILAFRA